MADNKPIHRVTISLDTRTFDLLCHMSSQRTRGAFISKLIQRANNENDAIRSVANLLPVLHQDIQQFRETITTVYNLLKETK